jgi:hypothetical protein
MTREPWALAGKWDLLDHAFPYELRRGFYLTLVNGFFNEAPNNTAIVLRQLGSPLADSIGSNCIVDNSRERSNLRRRQVRLG